MTGLDLGELVVKILVTIVILLMRLGVLALIYVIVRAVRGWADPWYVDLLIALTIYVILEIRIGVRRD